MARKLFILMVISLVFSGCGRGTTVMDKPAADGSFYYSNRDLGFALTLPAEFKYYQTQRKEAESYIDIEIFVPTSDTDYPQEIQSYAKPLVIRIFTQEAWDNFDENEVFAELATKGKRVYTIGFWDSVPTDWADVWNEEMRTGIIESFGKI